MKIIAYQKGHYSEIYQLLKEEGWISYIDTHKNEYKVALETSLTFVAKEEDEIIGFIRAISDGLYLTFIGEIIIAKEYRKKAIGTKLINFIETNYPTCKFELICDEETFYHKNGFKNVGLGQRKQRK